jgi:hypothetical protein
LRRWATAYKQYQQEEQPGYYHLDMTSDELEEASEALLAAIERDGARPERKPSLN